jgi:hypothetical protein
MIKKFVLHVKYRYFDILMKLEFSNHSFFLNQKSNFMKISDVRAQSLHADGRHVEANSHFSQFANVSDDEKLG